MSDLVLVRNCCLARKLPGGEKPSLCQNEHVCQGGQKV